MLARDLHNVTLFAGLGPEELEGVQARLRPRRFEPGEALCVEGEPGGSLLVIASGLARVTVGEGREVLARLRRGDVLGEMSLLGGEPRSATVTAVAPTVALELERGDLRELLARAPGLYDNLLRLLRERLVQANRRTLRPRTHAAVLVVGPGQEARAEAVIRAAQAARGAPLLIGDRRRGASLSSLLDAAELGDVLAILTPEDPALDGVLEHVDRAALLVGEEDREALSARLGARARIAAAEHEDPGLGRYLARARLGLALGAGGARGYAHVGALRALESAGYRPDAVAGSSIGGVVGACVAMGMDAGALEETLRRLFTPDHVSAFFRLSLGPSSPAMALWTRLLRELTEDRDFSDLALPLVVMTTDLDAGEPAPLSDGPVWEALLATTALPGMAPPVRRGERRLVDGLALVPVPTRAVEPLADVTVSVNLMSREILPSWPGETSPAPPRGTSALDVLLEAMELTHTEVSTREAARADVCVTPRFGPSTWKDFHRADAFLDAGRQAAEASLPTLARLCLPHRRSA